jgi:anti-anti-sigma factor
MLSITQREVGGAMVLGLRGTIGSGESADVLRDAVRETLAQGARTVVLDLTAATSASPAGVSALLNAKLEGLAAGAEVVVANVTRGMDMLVAAALLRYFDVFDTPESALARATRAESPGHDTAPLGAHVEAA